MFVVKNSAWHGWKLLELVGANVANKQTFQIILEILFLNYRLHAIQQVQRSKKVFLLEKQHPKEYSKTLLWSFMPKNFGNFWNLMVPMLQTNKHSR